MDADTHLHISLGQLMDVVGDGDGGLHLECCVDHQFYCGATYHPEASADFTDDERSCCLPCVDLRYKLLWPPDAPTHQHCPIDPGRTCPNHPTRSR